MWMLWVFLYLIAPAIDFVDCLSGGIGSDACKPTGNLASL
jgi:hypothetical protein